MQITMQMHIYSNILPVLVIEHNQFKSFVRSRFFIQAILIAMKCTFKHRDYLQMFEETSESMHFVSISIYLRVYSLHNK